MAKILIVEDDEMLRRIYENILTKEGYEVDVAKTGKEGLDKAESFGPALIVLDMLMPEMDGLEFLRAYDLRGKHPDVKVIVFSNVATVQRINEAVALGATSYRTKSAFSPKEMVEFIRFALK